MLGLMHKLHVKALNEFFDDKFLREDAFTFDAEIKKASVLVSGKMAYVARKGDFFVAVIINAAKPGDDPGFNLYLAWASSKRDLLQFLGSNVESRHKDAVQEVACLQAEYLWDPNWLQKRAPFFGWFAFRSKGISIKRLIQTQGKVELSQAEAIAEVMPACEQAWHHIERCVLPFFDALRSYMGKSYDDVAMSLS